LNPVFNNALGSTIGLSRSKLDASPKKAFSKKAGIERKAGLFSFFANAKVNSLFVIVLG
jgi:hypothetical protein